MTQIEGHNTLIFHTLDSTSSYLRENELPMGTLVFAHGQSAGRGRRGNSFYSPAGAGAYFSIKLPLPSESAWAVTFMAANAVCDALEELGAAPRIKWVNDVYLNEKKVCGILCEVRPDHLILGIGINVKACPMPDEIADSATSLEAEGIMTDSLALTERVVACLDAALEAYDITDTLTRYRQRCLLIGREITYTESCVKKYATALGIADNGNLICQRDGQTFTLSSGEVFEVRSNK